MGSAHSKKKNESQTGNVKNEPKIVNDISKQLNQKEEIQENKQINNNLSTQQKENNIKMFENNNNNELKIYLFPDRIARNEFETESLKKLINKDTLAHSLDKNKKLAYINSKVPVLNGFYHAHINHRSIRIKPDDIWLLIVQAFSNHVNANAEELRDKFVNFEGQKILIVECPIKNISKVDKKILENFSEQINGQMKKYIGEELLNILTPNFTTTDKDKIFIFKISIMGAFQKYFKYIMYLSGCGIPYLIIEGTAEDYEKIYSKTKELRKYDFEWYIDRILPIIQKFIEAKKGNVDVEFFKNIVQDKKITEYHAGLSGLNGKYEEVDGIKGWILKFFAYYSNMKEGENEAKIFQGEQIKVKNFENLANQMLEVPFTIVDKSGKSHPMKYNVGFIGCDKNEENEIFPVTGWIVSHKKDNDKEKPRVENNHSDGSDNDEDVEIVAQSEEPFWLRNDPDELLMYVN